MKQSPETVIRGQRLYEGNGYTRATVIRGQRLYEGNGYTRKKKEGNGYTRGDRYT